MEVARNGIRGYWLSVIIVMLIASLFLPGQEVVTYPVSEYSPVYLKLVKPSPEIFYINAYAWVGDDPENIDYDSNHWQIFPPTWKITIDSLQGLDSLDENGDFTFSLDVPMEKGKYFALELKAVFKAPDLPLRTQHDITDEFLERLTGELPYRTYPATETITFLKQHPIRLSVKKE
jgi:hypothetical protein